MIHDFVKSLLTTMGDLKIIAGTVVSFTTITFERFEKFWWIVCCAVGLNIVSDLCVTTSLCWFLQRSKTGFTMTDSVIDKLLLYMINAGVLTVVYNTFVLVCIATMRSNLVYVGGLFLVSKLYTSSLLAVVNSRKGLLREGDQNGSFEMNEIDEPQAYESEDPASDHMRRRAGFRTSLQLGRLSWNDISEDAHVGELDLGQKHPVDLRGLSQSDNTDLNSQLKCLPLEG